MSYKVIIQQEDNPSDKNTKYVSKQFRAFNDRQSGVHPSKDLHLFAYAPYQKIVGGLFGDFSWGWLHVDVIWVKESHQKKGISTSRMEQVEAEATSMGVFQSYLETTDFQAKDSYEKFGYSVFAQLEDQPPGHTCYYMRKKLDSK